MAIEGSGSSYVTVEIQEIGGSVVATTTRFVQRDNPVQWYDLTFELGVPDYSTKVAYYINIKSSVMSTTTRALLTVNRVWMWG